MANEPVTRRLSAILAADVAGYSLLMGADEADTLARFKQIRTSIVDPEIARCGGTLVGTAGDSLLVEFASAMAAVDCAICCQRALGELNASIPPERRIAFRMGINLGDVIPADGTIHGDGVNIAARIEKLAEPGGLCIAGSVFEQVRNKLPVAFTDTGEHRLRHIGNPVRVYRAVLGESPSPAPAALAARDDRASIAVLPLQNLSGDAEQGYFSDGISEDIITELSRFRELMVIARNSAFQFRDGALNVKDVAARLGVQFVLEGSVRKSGNRVRVSVQLVDGQSASPVWAERWDRQLDDIFAIQDEITEAVVARVAEGVKVARTRNLKSASAYDRVLQARPLRTTFTRASNARAAELLREAIALDPELSVARASLAFVRVGDFEEGWAEDPEAAIEEALQAARRAVQLDAADGYAHASLSYVLLKLERYAEATREAELALTLNPNHVNIIMSCAWCAIVNCEPERSIELINRARRLNPLMGGWELWTLGQALLDARRYREAMDAFEAVTEPPLALLLERAICLAWMGEQQAAQLALEAYLERARRELSPCPADPATWRSFLCRMAQRRDTSVTEHYLEGARRAGLGVADHAVVDG